MLELAYDKLISWCEFTKAQKGLNKALKKWWPKNKWSVASKQSNLLWIQWYDIQEASCYGFKFIQWYNLLGQCQPDFMHTCQVAYAYQHRITKSFIILQHVVTCSTALHFGTACFCADQDLVLYSCTGLSSCCTLCSVHVSEQMMAKCSEMASCSKRFSNSKNLTQ